MPVCAHCAGWVADGARSCPACGRELDARTPGLGVAVQKGDVGLDRSVTNVDARTTSTALHTSADSHDLTNSLNTSQSHNTSNSHNTTSNSNATHNLHHVQTTVSAGTVVMGGASREPRALPLTLGVVGIVAIALVGILSVRGAETPPITVIAETGSSRGSPTPENSEAAALEAAIALAAAGQNQDAVHALRELAARNPHSATVLANLCGAELQIGRTHEAELACLQAIQLAPANWLAHYNLSCVHATLGRVQEALDALEGALSTVETDVRAGLTRSALARVARGDDMLAGLVGHQAFDRLTELPQ